MTTSHVLVLFGTRPEAIKMAPVVRALRDRADRFRTTVCVTAQHREMLDQVLDTFEIRPDIDLNLMTPGQTLAGLTARLIEALDPVYETQRPDCVLVQGDTTTVLAGALTAFYRHVPVGHVEAGLRTGDKRHPFPEEINRRLAGHVADWHFAPTERARDNLLGEGIDADRVFVTGNTVIDALLAVRDRLGAEGVDWDGWRAVAGLARDMAGRRIVAITGHRRENFGAGFRAICEAIQRLARDFPDVDFVYPVHLNPNVQEPVRASLGGLDNVHLIEPLDYLPFVALMDRSELVLTDSGGLQEEAPALGKPVLVMREKTERPEAIEAGTARLVGTDADRIVAETARLLTDRAAYDAMVRAANPFGDGRAAERIVGHLGDLLR